MDEPRPLTPTLSRKFTDEQHKKLDDAATQTALEIFTKEQELSTTIECAVLLACIIEHSQGTLQAEFQNCLKAIKLMRENSKLEPALKKAWRTKDYKEIRKSKLLIGQKPRKNLRTPGGQEDAIENAWTAEYRDNGAPEVLWARIKGAMKKEYHNPYGRYLAIVQSSGTGKSRMVEELSQTHLVIPINLRDPRDTGYPPSDREALKYFSEASSQEDARVFTIAFLRAVFEETSKRLAELCKQQPHASHDQIVKLFSKSMSEGMTCEGHGHERQSFYEEVDLGARKLQGEIKQAFAKHPKLSRNDQLKFVGICEAFEELIKNFPSSQEVELEPLVILAFDEARIFAEPYSNGTWSDFTELRRTLSALADKPLFSLFLTTTGNVMVPSSERDLSSHFQRDDIFSCRPFCEVGFDQFAIKDQFNLRVVADDEHIAHFGRPLWATRYMGGGATVRSEIIQFAAHKLRAGRANWPREPLNDTEKLACLAQRLPIEFCSVTYASKMKELKLVEGHMRILLRTDAGFETVTTVSASEPLLSEASYFMMYDEKFNAAKALKSCLDNYSIYKGNCGELLVMLLFILARDRAIGEPDRYGRPKSGRRWCSVPDFMNALFKFKPDSPSGDTSLKTLFANSKIFFNHWIKVHEHGVMNVQYLAHLVRRGAALLSGTNQSEIDGIVPFLHTGYTICPENIGVILLQVKNDPMFTDNPEPSFFKAMDPYELDILNPGDNIPIIRIIFALAAQTPCLTRVPCQQKGLNSCDFWVGGISPDVFLPVGADEKIWTALLQATYGWEDVYKRNFDGKKVDKAEEASRRSQHPGTAEDDGHWKNWACFTEMDEIKEIKEDEKDENEAVDEIVNETDETDENDKEDAPMDED